MSPDLDRARKHLGVFPLPQPRTLRRTEPRLRAGAGGLPDSTPGNKRWTQQAGSHCEEKARLGGRPKHRDPHVQSQAQRQTEHLPGDMETEAATQTWRYSGTEKTRGRVKLCHHRHPGPLPSLTGCRGLLPLTSHLLSSFRHGGQVLWSKPGLVAPGKEPPAAATRNQRLGLTGAFDGRAGQGAPTILPGAAAPRPSRCPPCPVGDLKHQLQRHTP